MASVYEQREMVDYFMNELGPTARLMMIGDVPSVALRPVGRVVLINRPCSSRKFDELSDVVRGSYPSFVFMQDGVNYYRPANGVSKEGLAHYSWPRIVSMIMPTYAEKIAMSKTGCLQYFDPKDPSLIVYKIETVVFQYRYDGLTSRKSSGRIVLPTRKQVIQGRLMLRKGVLRKKSLLRAEKFRDSLA